MAKIPINIHNHKEQILSAMRENRTSVRTQWERLSEVYLPTRYRYLESDVRSKVEYRSSILDSTGVKAARILASGMMNGITSPSRQWFKLSRTGVQTQEPHNIRIWLDEVQRIVSGIFAQSNFYNAMATLYLDLVIFGTAAVLMYEDKQDVVHFYNPALGEYYLDQSYRLEVDTFAREFNMVVRQVVDRFGIDNCSKTVKRAWERGGSGLYQDVKIIHLIEPNNHQDRLVANKFTFQELYWESGAPKGLILGAYGFNELPGLFARWETVANDPYGKSPGMEGYKDTLGLQHLTKRYAQIIDKTTNPPLQVDAQLKSQPLSNQPGAVNFVNGLISSGRPGIMSAYNVATPTDAISNYIQNTQQRIASTFHNELFYMIAQLDTVRSATEVEALREEKLVLLGPVLERFENEVLEPAIDRIVGIANRRGILPELPAEIAEDGADLEIEYVSLLSVAQRAAGTAPIERFLQLIGEVSGVYPEGREVINIGRLLYDYARNLGVPLEGLNDINDIEEAIAKMKQQQEAQAALQAGGEAAKGAEVLSRADVGGGLNALSALTGGGQ